MRGGTGPWGGGRPWFGFGGYGSPFLGGYGGFGYPWYYRKVLVPAEFRKEALG